jgi:hypothetical protein
MPSILDDLLPLNENNETLVLDRLSQQSDFTFAESLSSNTHISCLVHFFDRQGEFPVGYLKVRGIKILVELLIKRLQSGGSEDYLRFLRRLPRGSATALVSFSPPTILSAFFEVLMRSGGHEVARSLLNQHPRTFAQLLLSRLRDNPGIELFRYVSNSTALRVLAEDVETSTFLEQFDRSDILPIVGDDQTVIGQGSEAKGILFRKVAGALVWSAATKFSSLNILLTRGPSELQSVLPEALATVCKNARIVPDSLIPFAGEIGSRFGSGIFSAMRDRRGLVCALKYFLRARPYRAGLIAGFIAKRRDLWGVIGLSVESLPSLAAALRQFVVEAFRTDAEEAVNFVASLNPTDFYGRVALTQMQRLVSGHIEGFCKLASSGVLSLRTAAVSASVEDRVWGEFCSGLRNCKRFGNTLCQLLSVIEDYSKSGNGTKAMRLLYDVTSIFAVGQGELQSTIDSFAFEVFEKQDTHYRENMILYIKILSFVHRHASVIRPLISDVVELIDSRVADLTLRYLLVSRTDERPDFLVFRLILLEKRRKAGQTPRHWTEEMHEMM